MTNSHPFLYRPISWVSSFLFAALTYKLRGAKDVLELAPGFDFVGDAEVDQFDARAGDVFVQQHDVFGLKRGKGKGSYDERCPLQTDEILAGSPPPPFLKVKFILSIF